jgi:hypothetical protein
MSQLQQIDLNVRTSHKYRLAWDHLNSHHRVGFAEIVESTTEWNDEGDVGTKTMLLNVYAKGYRPANVERAIRDTIQWSCGCEHDCCGCTSGYVSDIKRRKGNSYKVVVNLSLNI